jgi:hypothetical protein
MRYRWIFIAPAALMGIALVIFIGGEAVRLLWNWLLPPLFGWREVTFWQAFGLLALCRILFGGCGFRGSSRSSSPIRGRLVDRMADRVAERWQRMTPEERERFRQRMRERCGIDLSGGSSQPTPPPPV